MTTTNEFLEGFIDHFSSIKDHRQQSKVFYPVIEIIFTAVVAIAAKAETWEEIEAFAKTNLSVLREYFPFKKGIPSDDTIRRFFRHTDSSYLNVALGKYFGKDTAGDHFAIDGKSLRGSKTQENRALHLLNIYAAESGITLYGKEVDAKQNEITAIPEALEAIDIRGGTVTIDAMGCQKLIAKLIVEKEADYILALKENHGYFYKEIVRKFAYIPEKLERVDIAETEEIGHGRIEKRRCRVLYNVEYLDNYKKWSGLKTIVEVYRHFTENGKTSEETKYYISSSSKKASELLNYIRNHWKVESMHWVMDVVFNEDASKIRLGNAPTNMAIIRRFVLNILNRIKEKRVTRPRLMKMIGWSPQYLKLFIDAILKN
jgi:predicted transposase YbfD/YdcC